MAEKDEKKAPAKKKERPRVTVGPVANPNPTTKPAKHATKGG